MATADNDARRRALRELLTDRGINRAQIRETAALLKELVCAEYPGGPQGYRYVPEHCTRIGAASPSGQDARAPPRSSEEDRAVRAAIRRIRVPQAPAFERAGVQKKDLPLKYTLHLVQQLPAFMVYATAQFKLLRSTHPDPDERWEHVCRAWPHGDRSDMIGALHVKKAVLQLSLSSA